jgi:hypothetical protein
MWMDRSSSGIERTMLHWRTNQRNEDAVRRDIESARALLPTLRLKLDKEGPAVARRYGEGLVEVSEALAHALGVSPEHALCCSQLEIDQITAANRDLQASEVRCRQHLSGGNDASRALAGKLVFGCQVLSHLYRLRLHAVSAEGLARSEAEALAETYASMTGLLSEIAQQDRT